MRDRFPALPTAEEIRANEEAGFWIAHGPAGELARTASSAPDRPAVSDGERRLSAGELAALVERAANGLLALGVKSGDAVVVQLPNWVECMAVHLAVEAVGGVSVPLPPIYRSKEVGYILGLTRARVAVTADVVRGFDHRAMYAAAGVEHVVVVRPERPADLGWDELLRRGDAGGGGRTLADMRTDPNALGEIAFTSGSSGEPKGVMHTSNTLRVEDMAHAYACNLTSDDVFFMPSTLGHQLGFSIGLRLPVLLGAPVAYMAQWDPLAAVELIARERATFTVTTPTFLIDLLAAPNLERHGGLPSMRTWLLAGAVVPSSLHEEARRKMPQLRIGHVFGMTEVGGMIIAPPDRPPSKAMATGVPQRGLELRVLDASGAPVGPGVDGELAVKSPSLFLGYFGQPELTRECFTPDGFFRTGDQVRLDDDGYVYVTGRIKDLIKRGGENISPAEIEEVVARHPRVAEVAVVGAPDIRLGERVCAFVVLRDGAGSEPFALEELVAWVARAGMAKQKWPERCEVLDALPKTTIGKVHKAALRARLA